MFLVIMLRTPTHVRLIFSMYLKGHHRTGGFVGVIPFNVTL